MKKSIFFILAVLFLISIQLKAQSHYTVRQLNEMVGSVNSAKVALGTISGVDGTPYLYDDFKTGDVYYDGKYKIEQIPLQFNLVNDQFEYKYKNVLMAFSDSDHIDKIVIDDEVFIYLKGKQENEVSGFVKIWNKDLPAVLTKMKSEFKEQEDVKPFEESKPPRFERAADRHYIMMSDTEVTRIGSVKKLIKFLGTHQNELSTFAKKEKVSSGDPEELAQLLDYFHSLL